MTVVSSKDVQTRRRSQRLPLRIPIRIECSDQNCGRHVVDAFTGVISAHGALVRMPWEVHPGQELVLQNLATRERQSCTVVYVVVLENGEFAVGVDFGQPNPKFWGVTFPPDDWTPSHPDAKADL